jgi:hypothetical protein
MVMLFGVLFGVSKGVVGMEEMESGRGEDCGKEMDERRA